MSRIGNEFKPLPAGRCDDLIDSTLRLTNGADLFATFVLGDGAGVIRGRGLHSFAFPLNLSLLCPFPLSLTPI